MVTLSMLSFFPYLEKSDSIEIITTKPDYYKKLQTASDNGGRQVHVFSVSDETIEEWQGKHHFFWRAKIKAIEMIINLYPNDDIMYLDGDTFLFGSLLYFKQELSKGSSFMHLDEGHPRNMMTKAKRMWNSVKGRQYGGITIGHQHNMWNAGVVTLSGVDASKTVSLALSICDDMLEEQVERVVVEQYSLSIALYETTKLCPAFPYIAHYWGNKEEWISKASMILSKAYMQDYNIGELLKEVDVFSHSIPHIRVYSPTWQRRLIRWIQGLLPDRVLVSSDEYLQK